MEEQNATKAGKVFEGIKTSLPKLDIFDPSVFDIKAVIGALTLFGLITYLIFSFYMKKVVSADDFMTDLGISFSDFELPDEVEEYYEAKEKAKNDIMSLKNPLLKRAVEDLVVIMRLQREGPGIINLYKQAMIGEKEWRGFKQAEKIINHEIEQVQAEAELIEPGFGKLIWQRASEIRQALILRRQKLEIEKLQKNE
mmetsp:Transcript_2752/g.4116  ORF Transcript_2752/g.4116 Transcript_2752/m.4116 type:complete len:197 (+) Transcript_2752:68-658(+)